MDATSVVIDPLCARASYGVGLSVEGLLEVSESAMGITAQGGETSLQVPHYGGHAQKHDPADPTWQSGAFLWINTRAAGSFTIGASQALPAGLIIQFLIIN